MRRVTITLDGGLESKIRRIQAETIKNTGRTFSFSACVASVLKKGLK